MIVTARYILRQTTAGLVSLLFAAVAFGAALVSPEASADQFDNRKYQRVAACRSISASVYSTGMIFNPAGYETMFERSRCLQRLAIDERDVVLCSEVKERKSLFFDGSGVSEQSCRTQVSERLDRNAQEFAARDFTTIHRLKSLEFSRNGNGKDFDLVVITDGSYAGRYDLDIRISTPNSSGPVSIEQKSYPYGGPNVPRTIFLRRSLLADRLGGPIEDMELTFEITLQLAKTAGNRSYYDRIADDLRTSRLTVELRLSELPPWRPQTIE